MRLHDQVRVQKEMLALYTEQLGDLKRYLNSSKFHQDTTVQVGDIMLRLNELDNDLFSKDILLN